MPASVDSELTMLDGEPGERRTQNSARNRLAGPLNKSLERQVSVKKKYTTLESTIIGKRLREMAPAGRGKLRRKFRVPISNNYACLSIIWRA